MPPVSKSRSRQRQREAEEKEEENNNINNQQHNEPTDDDDQSNTSSTSDYSSSSASCTCCGCCPEGPKAWWSSLNKLAVIYFIVMFIVCVVIFAGAGMPIFETTDATKLWSAWYYCYANDTARAGNTTTTTSSGSPLVQFFFDRSYTCQETHLANDIYICSDVQTRMNQIGGLHITAFLFAVIGLFSSVGHVIKCLKIPVLPFLCALLVMACGGAAAAYTLELWDEVLCSGTVIDSSNQNMFPLFNRSLSSEPTLTFGQSWGAVAAATVLAALLLILSTVMCFFPEGGPRQSSEEEEEEEEEDNDEDENDDQPGNGDDDEEMEEQ